MSNEKITIEEAINQGYKYATTEHGEGELIPFAECDKDTNYLLVSKEGKPFKISDDLIKDLLNDYLCEQDEVADENGILMELAEKVDFSEITKKINEAFSKREYFHATEIRLVV